jgi:hypothetical protein
MAPAGLARRWAVGATDVVTVGVVRYAGARSATAGVGQAVSDRRARRRVGRSGRRRRCGGIGRNLLGRRRGELRAEVQDLLMHVEDGLGKLRHLLVHPFELVGGSGVKAPGLFTLHAGFFALRPSLVALLLEHRE